MWSFQSLEDLKARSVCKTWMNKIASYELFVKYMADTFHKQHSIYLPLRFDYTANIWKDPYWYLSTWKNVNITYDSLMKEKQRDFAR